MLIRILKWGFLLGLAGFVVLAALLLHDLPDPKSPVDGSTVTVDHDPTSEADPLSIAIRQGAAV